MQTPSLQYLFLLPIGLGVAFMSWVLWNLTKQLAYRTTRQKSSRLSRSELGNDIRRAVMRSEIRDRSPNRDRPGLPIPGRGPVAACRKSPSRRQVFRPLAWVSDGSPIAQFRVRTGKAEPLISNHFESPKIDSLGAAGTHNAVRLVSRQLRGIDVHANALQTE